MKITLTGAAGRLGSNVCRALVEAGHEVRAVDQIARGELPVKIEVANLLDREGCYRLLDGAQAVVHLANYPDDNLRDSQRLLNENVAMNTNVFQAARELEVPKIVFSSSVQVLGQGRKVGDERVSTLPYLPLDGEVPAQPSNIYGLSKQMTEEMLRYYAREAGMSCVAIRFPYLTQSAPKANRFRWGTGTERINELWSYLSMADASALIVAVLGADLEGFRVYFPAARSNRTGESARALIERHFAGIPLRCPLENIEALIDTTRIKNETGWEPRDEWEFLPREAEHAK